MAKQEGPVTVGKMNGMVTYKMRGVDGYITRKCYGPSAERIAKDPNYASIKNNNDKFRTAVYASTLIRNAFLPIVQKVSRGFTHSRMNGFAVELLKEWVPCEEHPFETDLVKRFIGYQFNKHAGLENVFGSAMSRTDDDGKIRYEFGGKKPEQYIDATHFSLTLSVAGIDFTNKGFTCNSQQSDFIAFAGDEMMEKFTVEAEIPRVFPTVFVVLMLTPILFQQNTYYWLFHQNYSAASIMDVYTNDTQSAEKQFDSFSSFAGEHG